MWNALKRFLRTFDEQGRARFAALASDQERASATLATIGVGAATLIAVLASLYFALYLTLAIVYLRDYLDNPRLWLEIYYYSLIFGAFQGGILGSILGWGLALTWQGRRHKAALTGLVGGMAVIAVLGLFQSQFYEPSIPLQWFVFWALVLFSPGYFTAACVVAWGLNLLSEEKR